MNFFGSRPDLLLLGEKLFYLGAMLCFVRLAILVLTRPRERAMVRGSFPPAPVAVRGATGWPFAACVLMLLFLQSGLYLVLVLAGAAGLLMETGRTAREQYGLSRLRFGALVYWSVIICGAVVFVELPVGWVVDRGMTALHLPHPEQGSVELFRHFTRPADILLFLLQAVVLAPTIEELFFRGFLFGFLKNYTSTGFALVLSAGVFAFAHANLGSVVQLWLLGLVLGLAYEHSGSLLLPIGIHACWNLLTAAALLLERGGG